MESQGVWQECHTPAEKPGGGLSSRPGMAMYGI
jgi:hypothetical protein